MSRLTPQQVYDQVKKLLDDNGQRAVFVIDDPTVKAGNMLVGWFNVGPGHATDMCRSAMGVVKDYETGNAKPAHTPQHLDLDKINQLMEPEPMEMPKEEPIKPTPAPTSGYKPYGKSMKHLADAD